MVAQVINLEERRRQQRQEELEREQELERDAAFQGLADLNLSLRDPDSSGDSREEIIERYESLFRKLSNKELLEFLRGMQTHFMERGRRIK